MWLHQSQNGSLSVHQLIKPSVHILSYALSSPTPSYPQASVHQRLSHTCSSPTYSYSDEQESGRQESGGQKELVNWGYDGTVDEMRVWRVDEVRELMKCGSWWTDADPSESLIIAFINSSAVLSAFFMGNRASESNFIVLALIGTFRCFSLSW